MHAFEVFVCVRVKSEEEKKNLYFIHPKLSLVIGRFRRALRKKQDKQQSIAKLAIMVSENKRLI